MVPYNYYNPNPVFKEVSEYATYADFTNSSLDEKDQIAAHAICHVLPSYREVLPMSILETMALGIPNISTRIASIPEVIEDEVQGLLIEAGDVEALANAMRRICLKREVSKEMSRQAYELMRTEFSVEICCNKLRQIYREVLHGK